MIKSYYELSQLSTYEERLHYLQIFGKVGEDTFGFDRYMNQAFYRSREWKDLRNKIFIRDNGCDLGVKGYDILDRRSIIIHHINPITIEDIKNGSRNLLDPNNLITVASWTHNLIHFGTGNEIKATLTRSPNDTCPWKK